MSRNQHATLRCHYTQRHSTTGMHARIMMVQDKAKQGRVRGARLEHGVLGGEDGELGHGGGQEGGDGLGLRGRQLVGVADLVLEQRQVRAHVRPVAPEAAHHLRPGAGRS